MKVQIKQKHPLSIRWNHWINFPTLLIMTWSGLMIYWANPAYFIPRRALEIFGLQQRLGEGLAWHFTFAAFFIANGLAYVTYLILSGHWRYLMPNRDSLRESLQVVAHDLRLRKGPLPEAAKYNAAQKLIYLGVLFMGIAMTATGLAIYKPIQLSWLTALLGGYRFARWLHFALTLLFVVFFLVHLIQVMKSGWANFASMITGNERVKSETRRSAP